MTTEYAIEEAKKRTRQLRPYPPDGLEESLVIAEAIYSQNAGRPMDRILLAEAVGRTPASSAFRSLIASSVKYGLTDGNFHDVQIKLTQLGESLAGAKDSDERRSALIEAAFTPEVFRRFYEAIDGKKLPDEKFAENLLRRDIGVAPELTAECFQIVKRNGEFVGVIRNVQGSLYVAIGAARAAGNVTQRRTTEILELDSEDDLLGPETEQPPVITNPQPPTPAVERRIFVGHGKNRKPMEQLLKVLDQFKIPHAVAIDEANAGRPISQKVAETMRSCSAGILIFTCDEEFTTESGEKIWRPSENVVYELGAASVLYGEKIVIFREEGVAFPSNFKDIGYITFEKDRLDAKGVDLIKELLAFDLVKLTV